MLKKQLKVKSRDNSREQKRIKEQITKLQKRKQSLEDAFLDGNIQPEDYKSISERIRQQLLPLERQLRGQEETKEQFEGDLMQGITTAFNLKNLYEKADVDDKFRIVGSMFQGKFVFEENQIQTTEMNEVLLWIMRNSKALEGIKKGEPADNGEFSSLVGVTGFSQRDAFGRTSDPV
jgi:hypothetical protein